MLLIDEKYIIGGVRGEIWFLESISYSNTNNEIRLNNNDIEQQQKQQQQQQIVDNQDDGVSMLDMDNNALYMDLRNDNDVRYKRRFLGDFELVSNGSPIHLEYCKCLHENDFFVFAGVLKQSQNPLKIWRLFGDQGGKAPIEVALEKERRFKGFGGATFCGFNADENTVCFRIACGLGLGKAYIFDLVIHLETYKCTTILFAEFNARQNSISGLHFNGKGKLFSRTFYDQIVQFWDLEEIQKVQKSNSFTISSKYAQSKCMSTVGEDDPIFLPHILDCLQAKHDEFCSSFSDTVLKELEMGEKNFLFPDCLVNPESEESYEGDLDKDGKPHGNGNLFYRDNELNAMVTFCGEWKEGKRCGKGVLTNDATGEIIYTGGWENDLKHGFGKEFLKTEIFEGNFLNGERCGYGSLQLLKQTELSTYISATGNNSKNSNIKKKKKKVITRYVGELYEGFWFEGKPHGIGKWTFPSRSKALNYENPDSLVHMGKIGCIVAHKNGNILREMCFHRLDGLKIGLDDQKLISCKSNEQIRNYGFSDCEYMFENKMFDFLSKCDVCWACCTTLDRVHPSKSCLSCGLKIHKKCISQYIPRKDKKDCCPMCTDTAFGSTKLTQIESNWFDKCVLRYYKKFHIAKTIDLSRSHSCSSSGSSDDEIISKKRRKKGGNVASLMDYEEEEEDDDASHCEEDEHDIDYDHNSVEPVEFIQKKLKPRKQKPIKKDTIKPSGVDEQTKAQTHARKTVRLALKSQTQFQSSFFKSQLIMQRKEEMKKRKSWNEQLQQRMEKQHTIEKEFNALQKSLFEKQRTLAQLQGNELDNLTLEQLGQCQDKVEQAIEVYRNILFDQT